MPFIKTKKTLLFPAALAVIFMSSIIIIVSPIGSKTFVPIPTPIIQNSKWLIYQNPTLGLTFEYPRTWTIIKNYPSTTNFVTSTGNAINLSIIDEINQAPEIQIYSSKKIIINNLDYLQQQEYAYEFDLSNTVTYIPFGTKYISFAFNPTPGNQTEKDLDDYNRALTTLIIDSQSNWQDYQNNDVGFSFKYPPTIKAQALQIYGSGNDQTFIESASGASFILVIKGNYDNRTGMPYIDDFSSEDPFYFTPNKKFIVIFSNNGHTQTQREIVNQYLGQILPTLSFFNTSKNHPDILIPSNWQILDDNNLSLIISNIKSKPTTLPAPGQIIVKFDFIHSALENYTPGKKVYNTQGIKIVEIGRYLDQTSSFGIRTYYRSGDPQVTEFESDISRLISKLKLASNL